MEVPVYNKQGQQVGSMTIDAMDLGGRINHALIKQAYVRGHTHTRQGSSRTKGRSDVEGSTRKLYKQKHTGNARVGSVRSGIRKGGGHAHNKTRTREDFRLDMPVKMRRKANRNALLAKLVDNEVRIIDNLMFDSPRTKEFLAMLEACKIDRTVLVALNPENEGGRLSGRNIESVTLCPAHELNCFNMLNHRYLIIAKEDLQAWLAGPSSKMDKNAKNLSRLSKGGEK